MTFCVRINFCILCFVLLYCYGNAQSMTSSKYSACSRYPMGTNKRPRYGDNGYEIRVMEIGHHKMIERFDPGRTYEVMIHNRHPSVTFFNFYLTAMLDKSMMKDMKDKKDDMMKMMNMSSSSSTGTFVHMANPSMTTNLDKCPNVVSSTYRTIMDKVMLRWTAPTLTKDCIVFKATVEKAPGIYFKDNGKLMYRICPKYIYASDEGVMRRQQSSQPPTIKNCCACGTATYKMKFQGSWIRQLHPRDYPENGAFVHWSNIIGATHNREYFIYYFGGKASPGVRSVCKHGDASVLESEFKSDAGSNILNIIKTRGIWQAKNMGETRTAIFAVNRTHHLMSMLTMLGPSPDWCAGISAADLCESDCTWKKKFSIDLYPWDAGIYTGNTYMAQNTRKEKQEQPIRRITKDWPTGNPFAVVNGKMRPVATVTVERLSPKKDFLCDRGAMAGVHTLKTPQNDGQEFVARKEKTSVDKVKTLSKTLQNMVPTMCFLSPWSAWTSCSRTCGSGWKTRSRRIERNLKPPLCRFVKLKEKRDCFGYERTCNYEKPCSMTSWSMWSPCNITCDRMPNKNGVRIRTRTFIRPKEAAVCKNFTTTETVKCTIQCTSSVTCSDPMVEGFNCYKPVTRYYYNVRRKKCLPFNYLGCKGSKNRFKSMDDCLKLCRNAFEGMATWQLQRTAALQEERTRKIKLASKGKTMRSCKYPMNVGTVCRGKRRKGKTGVEPRWYFDMKSRMCKEMKFKGCSGNENNFQTEDSCQLTCEKLMKPSRQKFTGPRQDCEVGRWGPWSPCSNACGGKRSRRRRVIKAPMNGGRRCKKLVMFEKCVTKQCKQCEYSQWSEWTSCTTTCGGGVKERTRNRQQYPAECVPVIPEYTDRAYCENKPCPLSFVFRRQ